MPVPELIRDSFAGQLIYYASGRRVFNYIEDRPDFILPERYVRRPPPSGTSSETATLTDRRRSLNPLAEKLPEEHVKAPEAQGEEQPPLQVPEAQGEEQLPLQVPKVQVEGQSPRQVPEEPELEESRVGQEILRSHTRDVEKGKLAEDQQRRIEEEAVNLDLVTWYGHDDPESPQNWSLLKKCFVTFDICLLTFSIYIGSAIYSPGTEDISTKFGISDVAATLGLTIFVVGYGVGPMFLSPLSEVPQIGRTAVYIVSLLIFVLLQIPTALCKNLGALIPLRFLAGFVGSPALATGGASLIDMWSPGNWAIVIGLWSLAAVCGPVLGPLVGGFAAQAEGWTWTIWILCWLSGGTFSMLAFCLPETSAQTILYRRAARLRRVTGNRNLRSQGEIDMAQMSAREFATITLVRPFVLSFREPIVACWNVYIALVYGILYIFIESFRVVFVEHHGFNIGENGLAFLGLFVGAVVAYLGLLPYAIYVIKPMFANGPEHFIPEARLPIAMVGSIFLPISMFWFGWTGTSGVHWISPIIASAFYCCGTYLLFQAGLNYLPDCYPRFVASVLAGNDFFRSMVGAAFPLFSTAFFHNLGVGPACSLLGGITIAMIPIPFILYKYGARIRSWSKYAD